MKQGLLLAIFASFLWGLAPILEKMGLTKLPPLAGLTIRSAAITAVLLVLSLFTPTWQEIGKAGFRPVFFIILGGLLAGLAAQWLYYGALKNMEASTAAPIAGSYPLFAFVLGMLILGESFTWTKVLGALLIVGGILLMKI